MLTYAQHLMWHAPKHNYNEHCKFCAAIKGTNSYTVNTRSNADGSEPCYVVYFQRDVVATFPVLDATTTDAREYAERFAQTMNPYLGMGSKIEEMLHL